MFWVPEYVVQRTVVNGESMENTLHSGESLLVEKVSYHFTDPSRYDIIVFYPQGRDVDEYYVKRIYGLPGETVPRNRTRSLTMSILFSGITGR